MFGHRLCAADLSRPLDAVMDADGVNRYKLLYIYNFRFRPVCHRIYVDDQDIHNSL
jgi:hypothetical protein